jgi:phosphoglycerate dehydrogenase-like enzyme
MSSFTIYCNADFADDAMARLRAGVGAHRLAFPAGGAVGVLGVGAADPQVEQADIVFGQPVAEQVMSASRVRWVHLTSAGYTRYDRDDLRAAFTTRGAALTKSSLVYDEPCALQVLAYLCAQARQVPAALDSQRGPRDWSHLPLRAASSLLRGEQVVLVGYGSIARRLVELLAPLGMQVSALRRHVAGDEPVPTYAVDDPRAARALAGADHVVDLLPDSPATRGFFDAGRLAGLKRGAVFYNIGRGTTVDESALRAALGSGALGAAYLDVTAVEPLPPDHPLWTTTRCYITPHTAGGHRDEGPRLVGHFLDNLDRFVAGRPLLDRIV